MGKFDPPIKSVLHVEKPKIKGDERESARVQKILQQMIFNCLVKTDSVLGFNSVTITKKIGDKITNVRPWEAAQAMADAVIQIR